MMLRRVAFYFLVALFAGRSAALADKAADRAEAAQHYKRAMVFVQQGAYKEAEQSLRNAEKKDDENLEYQFSTAYVYLKLHRPDDAMKRYQKVYKNDPANTRAVFGIAVTFEDMQNYRDAVKMWMRYVKMDLLPEDRADGARFLDSARELFAERYEIAEGLIDRRRMVITPEQEKQIGMMTAQSAALETAILFDPQVNTYVRALTEKLVSNAKNLPASFKLLVFDTTEVNAFATPGFLIVNRGLLEWVSTEAELVGVLGHELGHTVARHVAKAVSKQLEDQATIEKLQQGGKFSQFLGGLMALGYESDQAAYSREHEAQADRFGVHIAYDSGYDPTGLASVAQKFESMDPTSRKQWDLMSRTHPFNIDRLNAIKEEASLLSERALAQSMPDFDRLKTRLKTLPPAPDAKGVSR